MDIESNTNSPNHVGSPTGILKRLPAKQSNVEEGPIQGFNRKPFKLRFGKQHDLGRSSISSSKPQGLLPILTSKFYSKEMNAIENEKCTSIKKIKHKIDILYHQGPREIFTLPNLESHKYGWYHDVQLTKRDRWDKRFNFGIQNSAMVKFKLLILATDKGMEIKKPSMSKPKTV